MSRSPLPAQPNCALTPVTTGFALCLLVAIAPRRSAVAPPIPNAKRRRTSVACAEAKVRVLAEQYPKCHADQQEAEADLWIAMIVEELQKNPEKIKPCLGAVRGTAFLSQETLSQTFCKSAIYMFKIPKSWVEEFIESRCPPREGLQDAVEAGPTCVPQSHVQCAPCGQDQCDSDT